MSPLDQILYWTDEGIRRLQAAKSSPGSPLQLTHMVLGNASTPLPDIKQGTQVRNEVYRAPVDRVALDTEKKCIVCELMMPENKREQEIREIGVFEHETLVAIGYVSSRYTPVQQKDRLWTYIVHIPLEDIPASAIETVDNLININVSDTRYLNASENLREISNQATARKNLGLGTPALAQTNLGLGDAALKNVGTTNIDDLITTGDADERYLKTADNVFSNKADKEEVSKLIDYFNLIFGDIDGVSYLLRPGLTSDELESWLTNVSNLKNFTVVDSTSAMNAVAASTTAMNAVATSLTAKEILRNSPKAMAVIGQNSMAIAKLATGLVGLNPRKYTDMTAVAASTTAMNAVVNSGLALNAIVKSESACVAIEINLQNHRSTVKQTLNGASPNLFKKESTNHLRDTTGTHEHNQGAANIIILTNWSHLKTHYGLHSTLGSHQKLADLYQYSSSSSTPSCVGLRGIRIVGNDSSAYDIINFDVYTAV